MTEFWMPRIGTKHRIYVFDELPHVAIHYCRKGGMMLCRRSIDERCPACEEGSDDEFDRIYYRGLIRLIDVDEHTPTIKFWLAAPSTVTGMAPHVPYVTVMRDGNDLFTKYIFGDSRKKKRFQEQTPAMKIIRALVDVAVMPQLEYPPIEEVIKRHGFTGWYGPDVSDYMDWIPFDQGAATPYVERRDFFARQLAYHCNCPDCTADWIGE